MRREDFDSAAESVRSPQFKSVQQQSNDRWQAMSILDLPSSLPNQNGMGAADLQRRMMGVPQSPIGSADSTYDRRLWLRSPTNSQRRDRGSDG